MSHPWEKEYRPRPRVSLRHSIKRKIKTGIFAVSLVTMCYLAVAKHSIRSTKSVK